MSSHKVSNIDSNTPVLVFFKRENFEIPPDVIRYIRTSLHITGEHFTNINQLSDVLSRKPRLIVFDAEFIRDQNVTVLEFVQMVHTMIKYHSYSSQPSIGIILTKNMSVESVKELRDADVNGVIPFHSDFGADESIEAMKQLLEEKTYWPRHLIDQLPRARKPKTINRTGIRLTPRQRQVMELVCSRGLSNKKIAQALKISESTVKIHMSAILKQYQVRNRTQLALTAKTTTRT